MRKLASVQRIVSIEPIKGADRIEKARVLGWQCVVGKGQFKVGDFCCYIEIDSILPDEPEFSYLEESDRKRLRTRKFKGEISQGLIISIDAAEAIMRRNGCLAGHLPLQEGYDLTEALGIKKYEPPIPEQLKGIVKAPFPVYLCPKTDETRVQAVPDVLREFNGRDVYITTKMDGTSATYILDEFGVFHVCSRNVELEETQFNTYWQIARTYCIEEKLRCYEASTNRHLALQGEICGPGIQGNPLGLSENRFYVFNVWSVDEHRYLDYSEMCRIVDDFGLELVPLDCIVRSAKFSDVNDLLERAKGYYPNKHPREGIVIRPLHECYSGVLCGRLSVKVINNDYLLAENWR